MRLRLLLLLLMLSCPAIVMAQTGYTTVTATVVDSNGSKYVNAPFTVTFFDPGTSGKLPTLSGSVFNRNYNGYATDGNGNLSISLPDNGIIASSSGATGTQWVFSICTAVGAYTTQFCIPATAITITGATQNISANLTAVAPLLPIAPGTAIVLCVTSGGVVYQNGSPNIGTCTGNLIWDPVNGVLTIVQQTTGNLNIKLRNANDANPNHFAYLNQNSVNGFGLAQNQSTTTNVIGAYSIDADGAIELGTENEVTAALWEFFTDSIGNIGLENTIGGTQYIYNWPTVAPTANQVLSSPGGTTETLRWVTPAGSGISGMTAGQVAIAASASSIGSSTPIQGTDSSLLSSGTMTGATGVTLCKDANGGATTVGCTSTSGTVTAVDDVGQSAAIGTTAILTCPASPSTGTNYLLNWSAKVTTVASGGSPSSTLGPLSLTYTTPDNSTFTAAHLQYTIWSIVPGSAIDTAGDTGNTASAIDMGLPISISCKAGSTISYAESYTSVGGTNMVYDLHIRLTQQ